MAYRVDTVPRAVRPFYLAATWSCGIAFYVYYSLCRLTSRISIEGPGSHDLSQHAIFCLWHDSWLGYFVVFNRCRSPHAVMTHPAAYMKPAHTVFRLMGVRRLLLGSSGEEGRRAANEIARLLREGCSTAISPDGPYGPQRVLKKGVLHIALQSGVPIVPLTIRPSSYVTLPSWDSKPLPLPFGRIVVTVHAPIAVEDGRFDEAGARLAGALDGSFFPDRHRPDRAAA